ncbi:MAG: LytTR family DNA-binding domain-containing protein [Paracoccaceae bacterium]
MAEFLKEYVARIFSPLQVFVVLVVVCFLTIAGPFGTYEGMSVFERAIYWGLMVVSAILLVTAIKMLVTRFFPKLEFWQYGLTISTIFTLIYSPFVVIWEHTMPGRDHVHFVPVWMTFLIVFAVSMAMVQIRFLLLPQREKKTRRGKKRARLFGRFDDRSVKQIYRMTVRDHYVDVFTDRGTETLLMRFSDAIAELDGIRGSQVHRSHWVACNAMVSLDRENGKYMLLIKDGGKVPVSRSHRAKVEAHLSVDVASESSMALIR